MLAAGEGRRMGGVAKPLIRLQGVPLATRQLVIEATASGHRAGVLGGAILGAHGALSPDRLAQWIRSGTPA